MVKKIKKEQKKSPENQYVPVEEFAESKGLTPEKAIQMIRDGFYQGRIIEDHWYVSYSELDSGISTNTTESTNFFSKLAGGEFGLARTYWFYGVFIGFSVNILSKAITSISALVIFMIIYTAYEIPVLMGIWRASDKYQGRSIWAGLAKIAVVIGAIMLVAGLITIVGVLDNN